MDIREIVIEALRSAVIPELNAIKEKICVIEARLDGMDKRFEDMNLRFEDMRADMNKRFEEHFNFNMKRFDSIESQINNILAEIRELRGLLQNKPDMEQFRSLENRYIELFREVTLLKQKVA